MILLNATDGMSSEFPLNSCSPLKITILQKLPTGYEPQQTVDETIDEFGSAMPRLADPNSLACLQGVMICAKSLILAFPTLGAYK